jgi:hypothetical protein
MFSLMSQCEIERLAPVTEPTVDGMHGLFLVRVLVGKRGHQA